MITSLFAALALSSAADDLSVERIPALQALIKPRPEETRWEQIPWQVDLWDDRKKSAREGKPIMLWEMDGNPMGCG